MANALWLLQVPNTLLLPRLVLPRMPRWITSASRVTSSSTWIARIGIAFTPADTALHNQLFSGLCRIICLHLFVFTRVYTPVMASTDMW